MTAPDTPSTRALLDAAALLWPAPCSAQVRVGGGRGGRSGARAFVLVPSADDPRLAVPLVPAAAAAAVAAGHSAAGSARAAVRDRLMTLAFRLGAAPLVLRGRLTVDVPAGAPALDDHLAHVLGRAVAVGVRLGPPRANRKPVLQVVSPSGELVAFTKVGTGPLTDRLVADESAALERLAATDLGAVRVPRVLHAGTWQGHPLLVQEPLPVRRAGTDGDEARVTGAMVAVAGTGAGAPLALCDLPWWGRTSAAADALPATATGDRLRAVRDRLARSGHRVLAVAAWHGDWNAGNCSVVPGAVLVWDWERYETGVPAGFDALHLALQNALHRPAGPGAGLGVGAAAPRSVLDRAVALTAPFGVAAPDARLVATLYLWGIAVRYAADDQEAAGAAVGRLDGWLLPVLEREAARGDVPAAETKER
ncbi:MAG: hypothetical protein ACXVXE_13105 [Nocardioidaceae bacterium]